MNQLTLKIVTPEKSVWDQQVSEVLVPTSQGTLGILPHHTALMAQVIPGELIIKDGSKSSHFAVGEGFLQVSDNVLTILTDLAKTDQEIDERQVEEARKRAQEALDKKVYGDEYAEALATLSKSLAQLKVKRRHRLN